MSQLCLTNPNVCPPDGFRYTFPEDGFRVHAWTYYDWIEAGLAHLRANNLEGEETLRVRMEEQLCLTLEPGWCMYDDPMRPRANTSLGWDDVQAGLKTFARWAVTGAKTVAQTEANRRAEICTRCYMNVHVTGCSACQKLVEEVVGKWKTPYDSNLRNCAVCRCFLRAKVHFPLEILDSENTGVQSLYPGHCWLRKGGINRNG